MSDHPVCTEFSHSFFDHSEALLVGYKCESTWLFIAVVVFAFFLVILQNFLATKDSQASRAALTTKKGSKEIVGYRREEVCKIQRIVLEETIERIDGYRIEVEVDNRIVTLESQKDYENGQRIELSKRTTYSLK